MSKQHQNGSARESLGQTAYLTGEGAAKSPYDVIQVQTAQMGEGSTANTGPLCACASAEGYVAKL